MERLVPVALTLVALCASGQLTWPLTTASIATSTAGATDSVLVEAAEEEFVRRLTEAKEAYTAVNDYVSTLVVQERLNGDLSPRRVGFFKFKKPFAVYIRWDQGSFAGTRVLYVRGRNDGKMLARRRGLAGLVTLRLDPASKLAMRENRHPITEAGIGHMIEIIGENCTRAITRKEGTARRLPDRPDLEPPGVRYELIVTAAENAGYYCKRAVVTFDPMTHLLVAVRAYDRKGRLIEDYRYLNLRLNVGLTEADFAPENPEYGF